MRRVRQRWSKDLVIARIKERVANGLPINSHAVKNTDSKLYLAGRRYFGEWKDAVEASDFSYESVRKQKSWSKRSVLSAIKARKANHLPLSVVEVQSADNGLYLAGRRHFGTWEIAVKKAGFRYRDIRKCEKGQDWSERLIISNIRKRVRNHLSISAKATYREDQNLFQAGCRYFGNWRRAVKAAGFSYGKVRKNKPWSKPKVLAGIRRRVAAGRSISVTDMYLQNRNLHDAGLRHFGSWESAVGEAGFNYQKVLKQWNFRHRIKYLQTPQHERRT